MPHNMDGTHSKHILNKAITGFLSYYFGLTGKIFSRSYKEQPLFSTGIRIRELQKELVSTQLWTRTENDATTVCA